MRPRPTHVGGERDLLDAERAALRSGRLTRERPALADLQQLAGNRAVAQLVTSRPQVCRPLLRSHGPVNRLALQRSIGRHRVSVQRKIGDGHDLTAERFAGQGLLEATFDNQARVRRGSDSDAVTRIQEALIDAESLTGHHYDLGQSGPQGNGVDGDYGSKTEAAVRQFKADHNLGFTQFGDVGPGTMAKLDSLFVGKGGGGGLDKPASIIDGEEGIDEGPPPEVPVTPESPGEEPIADEIAFGPAFGPDQDSGMDASEAPASPHSDFASFRPSLRNPFPSGGQGASTKLGVGPRSQAMSFQNPIELAGKVRCAAKPIVDFLNQMRSISKLVVGMAADTAATILHGSLLAFATTFAGPIGTFFAGMFSWFAKDKIKDWISRGLRVVLKRILDPLDQASKDLSDRIVSWGKSALAPVQSFWEKYVNSVLDPFLRFAANAIRWIRNTLARFHLDNAPVLVAADKQVNELREFVNKPFDLSKCPP